MRYLLYCAINNPILINETIYSLLSLSKTSILPPDVRIIILTNLTFPVAIPCEDWSKLQSRIIIETISDQLIIDRWTNNGAYRFNIKIEAIRFVLDKYEGDVLFIDSDTILIKDPTPLFDRIRYNQFVLLYRYQPFRVLIKMPLYHDAVHKLVISRNRLRIRTYRYAIQLNYYHYNSGLIGISYKNKELLADVLTLSNCAFNELNLIVAEEFAFSCIFQKYGDVYSCDQYAFHYLYAKWARFLIARYFGYFQADDLKEYKPFFSRHGVDIENIPASDFDRLPYLIHFVDSYLLKHNSISRDLLYLGGKDSFADHLLNDSQLFQRYIRLYEKNCLANRSPLMKNQK